MTSIIVPIVSSNYPNHVGFNTWSVKQLEQDHFKADRILALLPERNLEVANYGLVDQSSVASIDRKGMKPKKSLRTKARPEVGNCVWLVIDIAKPLSRTPGRCALFYVREVKPNKLTGGILVAVPSSGIPKIVESKEDNDSPLKLRIVEGPMIGKSQVYGGGTLGDENGSAPWDAYVGVRIKNDEPVTLNDVVFYTECVTGLGIEYDSHVFSVDRLDPGQEFYATFPVKFGVAGKLPGAAHYVFYAAGRARTRVSVAL